MTEENESILYEPVKPEGSYDRGTFVDAMTKLSGLENLVRGASVQGNDTNPQLVDLAGKILFNDENHFYGMDKATMRKAADKARKGGSGCMAKYAEKNSDTLFRQLDENALYNYLMSERIPELQETGDKDHDKAIRAANEIRKMRRAKAEDNIAEYVAGRKAEAPKWLQDTYGAYMAEPNAISKLFSAYMRQALLDLEKATTVEVKRGDKTERVFDKSKLTAILEGSLAKAKAGNKAGPYYLALAHAAYENMAEEEAKKKAA